MRFSTLLMESALIASLGGAVVEAQTCNQKLTQPR